MVLQFCNNSVLLNHRETPTTRKELEMTYETFKAEYTKTFKRMMSYSPGQIGSGHFAEKLADLSELYPEFEERLESEV